jgi:hypothetical protein
MSVIVRDRATAGAVGPREGPEGVQFFSPRVRALWELSFGGLALATALAAPAAGWFLALVLAVACELAWLALLPRLLGGPRRGWATEAARVTLAASFPAALLLFAVACAPLGPAGSIALGACASIPCLAAAAPGRPRRPLAPLNFLIPK